MRYLSLEWIDALTETANANPDMVAAAAEHTISVTQVVNDSPEGDITYHLEVADGVARFGAGPADAEDVRVVQDWDTAVAVATGTLEAKEALFGKRIAIVGDQDKLMACQSVFRALDAVFTEVGRRTDYR